MSNVTKVSVPSKVRKLTKAQLQWTFYRSNLKDSMTKEEMLKVVAELPDQTRVLDVVDKKEEY